MSSMGVKASARPPLGVRSLLTSPHYYGTLMWLTLALEAALGVAIIKFIPYTEIDWRAYMQEVEGVLSGEWDYQYLRGDTGPLVYPAGFVYIFIALRWLTDEGTNILRAQYIFLGIYLTFMYVVMKIYQKCNLPPYMCLLLFASRRIHSIFMLRLFNDGICMELMYIAVLCILANRWNLSAMFLTLALSIKMNILLFLPAYGILCIQRLGVWRAIGKLVIIIVVQVLLAVPFLLHAPQSYMKGAFDFGRQFMYIWTVNLKVLPEEIFLSKNLAQGLLVGHVIFLVFFLNKLTSSGLIPFFFQSLRSAFTSAKQHVTTAAQSPLYVVSILFITNFAGIVFARSLHYQFYVWYYHTLPLLLYLTPYPHIVRWSLLLLIELVWNIYPSRAWSSALLIVCHSIILIGLMISRRLPDPPVQQQAVVNKKVQ